MKRLLTLFAITAALPGLALAATDGTLGDSSSGTADITFNVTEASGAQIQVTSLEDISFTTSTGAVPSGAPVAASNFCVYMTGGTAFTIQVTATPLISAQFQNSVPYQIGLFEFDIPFFVQTITDQTVIQSQTSVSLFSDTIACEDDEPSLLIGVSLDPTAPPMEAGIATATITLTVSPD